LTRALLAIGCNAYDDSDGYDHLNGAETDAQRVYERLTQSDVGGYDPARSRLLLSPTSQDVVNTLIEILAIPPESVTIFFAGHSACESGGVYLCLRDTIASQLWHHSVPLTQIFGYIAGAQPTQANIIIDACFSGGLVGDLGAIIKPEILGAANTLSVTLLAMAAMDQTAGEFPSGGIGTNALLACIDGETFVQDHSSALELTEIAPIVPERVQQATSQQPVWWALNRQRRETFCRNPNYQASAESSFERWNPRLFLDSIAPALASHSANPFDVVSTLDRLTENLVERSSLMPDAFLTTEVRAVRIAALLDYFTPGTAVESKLYEERVNLSNAVKLSLDKLADALDIEDFALLSPRAGLADLYHLPIRITKVLGWMGAAYHIDQILGQADKFPTTTIERIVDKILANYTGSIGAMCDSQAPYVLVGLTALNQMNLKAHGEQIMSVLFNSVISVAGAIADNALPADQISTYLTLREARDLDRHPRLLARPSELITALLKLATRYDLDGVFDESLAELDHLPINAFFCSDYTAFAKPYMSEGHNHSMLIGHDIWKVRDLEEAWPAGANLPPSSPAVQCAAIISSLLFPNRVPWFLGR
jgi:hypothetical protein